jgi:hypothetical protein
MRKTTLIPNQENFQSITAWLNKNFNEKKCIPACGKQAEEIPTTKGIYFWFMDPSCYKKLKNTKALTPVYTKKINDKDYHLVYTGTAGVRNNSNGINNGNLNTRILWHLSNNNTMSSLRSGTMSTFRRTIGSLLGDDLIENDMQDKLDAFFCEHFYIYYIEYPGTFLDVKDQVNSDESVLIDVLRPIFNLDKNPNAKIVNHTTYNIQKRRQLVENNSKNKWSVAKKSSTTSKKGSPKKRATRVLLTESTVELLENNKNCVEFTVNRKDNISSIAESIKKLPVGPCKIEIFSNDRNDSRTYINTKSRSIRAVNRTVSDYFNAVDPANGNIPKWQLIQEEMNNKKKIIETITVRVSKVK